MRRDQSAERREKNLAETALTKGMDEDGHGSKSHVAAARAAGFKSPSNLRVSTQNQSSSNHQHHTTTTTTTTFTTHEAETGPHAHTPHLT